MKRSALPSGRDDFPDLPVGHVRQTGEHVAEVGVRIEMPATAAFNDRVEDRAAFARVGFADEQPVFLPDGRWSDCVFYAEMLIMPRRRREA